MNIPDFELPLIIAQMEKITVQAAALEKSKADLQRYMQLRFGVDILSGNWSLDPSNGELSENPKGPRSDEVQRPDNGRPPDPD